MKWAETFLILRNYFRCLKQFLRIIKRINSGEKVGGREDQYIGNTGGQYSFIDGHWPLTGCYLQRRLNIISHKGNFNFHSFSLFRWLDHKYENYHRLMPYIYSSRINICVQNTSIILFVFIMTVAKSLCSGYFSI